MADILSQKKSCTATNKKKETPKVSVARPPAKHNASIYILCEGRARGFFCSFFFHGLYHARCIFFQVVGLSPYSHFFQTERNTLMMLCGALVPNARR
jgi:hypothetical protein